MENTDITPPAHSPLVIAFGGGTNSTAMLCGFLERGEVPAFIQFADTGGELDATYAHVEEMSAKVGEWWGLKIHTVQKLYQGKFEGLAGNCIRKKMLPSLAYGRKACSQKYKIEPQTRGLKQWMDAQKVKHITRCIGYDAGESHRALHIIDEDLKKGRSAVYRYPLVEWNWRRKDCIEAIARHGITQPGKSACTFCPASKAGEILALKRNHPEKFAEALAIEANADLRQADRGLGGAGRKWSEINKEDSSQLKLWQWIDTHDASPVPCGCYDG